MSSPSQQSGSTGRNTGSSRHQLSGMSNGQMSSDNRFITTPHTPSHSGTPLSTIDPAMLLNPKAGQASRGRSAAARKSALPPVKSPVTAVQKSAPQFVFSTADDISGPIDLDEDMMPGQVSMLERMHNVEQRSQRPSKRMKRSTSPVNSETGRATQTWSRSGGAGQISQHLKDKRKEALNAQSHSPNGALAIRDEIEASLTSLHRSGQANAEETVDLTGDTVDVDLTTEALPTSVDLTQDAQEGERDFYVVNGKKIYYDKNDAGEIEVCYGRVEGARITCHYVPDPGRPIPSRSDWTPIKVKLVRSTNKSTYIIKAYDPTGKDFGNVDPRTSMALKQFLDSPVYRMRLEARTDFRPKKQYEAPGQPTSEQIVVHINLFGPRKYAVDPVGRQLSQKQVWLRTPSFVPHNKDLFNPHCNDPEQSKLVKKASQQAKGLVGGHANSGFRSRTIEEAQYEVQTIFDGLQKSDNLTKTDPDPNVVSDLLDHQKQALTWMLERETPVKFEPGRDSPGTLWRCSRKNGRDIWHHVITGHETKEHPPDTLGGLLADMMGLGKTLSVLSLLSYTLPDANSFAHESSTQLSEQNKPLRNVKTTLLVCPVSVITNWEDQIMQHIRENGLTYYAYHGSNRKRDLNFLSTFDIVLTSYSIVKSEMFPASRGVKDANSTPFMSANFFRVVLDEAHTIRTQNTQQSLACGQLHASRRWALTATPVQNKLEDLGAIIRFLRVHPFHIGSIFGQYILNPFKNADPEALKHLRILVDNITLRRLKDAIDLSPRQDETVKLSFSEEEQHLYNFFASDASQRLKAITSSVGVRRPRLGGKGFMNILRSILCLRQICAHGKGLLRDEDMRLIEGQSTHSAIDVEEEDTRPALEERQAYQVFELLKETNAAVCISCNKPVTTVLPDLPEGEDETFCTMLPCYQILCQACAKGMEEEASEALKQGQDRLVCPFCEQAWRISLFSITASGMARAERLKEELAKEPKKQRMLNRYEGPSTKTIELVSRLRDSELESVPLMKAGEMPIKSVIFSAWTSHLDLISIALENEGIEYCTMVGSMNRKQRRESLDVFRTSATTNVFLVSIGTGGVGLNLTAANKVYLMDIGFNPMAEQQAIDRVHRLGQKRRVTFTRFLMHNSIEEKILVLQRKKMDLADLSLQRGKVDKAEAVRERLQELKDLFK